MAITFGGLRKDVFGGPAGTTQRILQAVPDAMQAIRQKQELDQLNQLLQGSFGGEQGAGMQGTQFDPNAFVQTLLGSNISPQMKMRGLQIASSLPRQQAASMGTFSRIDPDTGNVRTIKAPVSQAMQLEEKGYERGAVSRLPQQPDTRTPAIKEFEYGLKNPAFVLARQRKKDAAATKENKGKLFGDSTKLRKEFLSQSKDFQKVRDSYTRVVNSTADPSPAGDLSLIFNYMKMLDPGSVVRESEFATAAASGSYGERMKAAASKIIKGERLSPQMRADFVSKSKVLLEGMQKQHNQREKNYTNIAKRNRLPVADVVVDINLPSMQEDIQTTQAPAAAVSYLQANPQFKDQFQEKYGYLPEGF